MGYMTIVNEEWYGYPKNLVDMFEDTVRKFPDRPSFGIKKPDGNYKYTEYRELGRRVDNLRGGLSRLGIKKDDSVGLIIDNSVEWVIIAFATYGCGARLVPMYEKELEKVWKYIIKDSGVKVLFVVNHDVYEKVKGLLDDIETLEKIVIIQGKGENNMAALAQCNAGVS